MDNIKKGDILKDRDTRRVGRMVKVVFVEEDSVTVEVIQDSLNSKKSTIGNTSDIARSRLKKGYTLMEQATISSLDVGSISLGYVATNLDTTSLDHNVLKGSSISTPHIEPSNDLLTDTNSLEDALNTAGYFWLPPVEVLAEAIADEAENLTKSGLVVLVHGIIKQGLVTSN